MAAFMYNKDKVKANDPAPIPIVRTKADFAPHPHDLDPPQVDINQLENSLKVPTLTMVRQLLLDLTFGDKMEMCNDIAEFLAKETKVDGFAVAMSIHLWAKGRRCENTRIDLFGGAGGGVCASQNAVHPGPSPQSSR